MTTWLLFVALTTGQIAVLDVPTEERCIEMLESINSGTAVITLKNGLRLPIADQGGISCMLQAEYEAKIGGGV